MPKVLEISGFRFYIYTDDHLPIHVLKGGGEAKIILYPEVLIKDNYGLKSGELRQIFDIIDDHYDFLLDKWNEIHNK